MDNAVQNFQPLPPALAKVLEDRREQDYAVLWKSIPTVAPTPDAWEHIWATARPQTSDEVEAWQIYRPTFCLMITLANDGPGAAIGRVVIDRGFGGPAPADAASVLDLCIQSRNTAEIDRLDLQSPEQQASDERVASYIDAWEKPR